MQSYSTDVLCPYKYAIALVVYAFHNILMDDDDDDDDDDDEVEMQLKHL